MASIRTRTETGRLFQDFRYRGVRCREPVLDRQALDRDFSEAVHFEAVASI